MSADCGAVTDGERENGGPGLEIRPCCEETWDRCEKDFLGSLLVLPERDRIAVRDLIGNFAGGDYNTADKLIGLLHRSGYEIVSASSAFVTRQAAQSLSDGRLDGKAQQ